MAQLDLSGEGYLSSWHSFSPDSPVGGVLTATPTGLFPVALELSPPGGGPEPGAGLPDWPGGWCQPQLGAWVQSFHILPVLAGSPQLLVEACEHGAPGAHTSLLNYAPRFPQSTDHTFFHQ